MPTDPASTGTDMNICIVSLAGYHVLSADADVIHVGGAEVQIVAVARGLLGRGHQVSFITRDHGQGDSLDVNGIRVFKTFSADAGWPIIRFVWPRWTSVWSALTRAEPDVCLQAAGDSWTGIAAAWCRWANRPFVFVSMSEGDCDPRLPFLSTWRDQVLYRYGLRRAGAVVLQTEVQRRMMRDNFQIDGVVVRPCCAAPSDGSPDTTTGDGAPPGALLWIGRFSPEKRVEWFLDMAEACPDLTCHVVGGANEPTDYSESVTGRMHTMSNVVVHGFIPHKEIGSLYRAAGLLVTTSVVEGFPTTFMEAWGRGIPTVATVDPDGLIASHGLGGVAVDVPGLVREARRLLGSTEVWRTASGNVKRFFEANHSIDAAGTAYDDVLTSLVARGSEPAAACGA